MGHVLDEVVAGRAPTTAYAEALRLPRIEGWERGRAWTHWDVDPAYLTPWGAVFGGFLAALVDELAGTAALTVLDEGQTFGTVDLRVSPLRAVREGRVSIEARVVSEGRSAIHVEVELRRADGVLAVKGSAIQVLSRA
ncbi:MAG: PaaI family thioesterase [Myxococcota bacterium]